MNRRHGFTLVELLMASVLTVIVVGTLASLYLHVSTRTAHSVADVSTVIQHQQVLETIGRVANNAMSCVVVSSGGNTGLKCIMPNQGDDKTSDGVFDRSFVPTNVSRRQIAKYTQGKRVWFYRSDNTGAFTNTGPILWRAVRDDDALPTAADADASFAFHYGSTNPKWNLVEGITFALNSDKTAVTVTLLTSSATREDRARVVADSSTQAYTLPSSRTFYFRNWRK